MLVAQAQKEFTVNEALARLDGLLHAAVAGEANVPPAAPNEGECWIVGPQPSADWVDHTGDIAFSQAENWLFAAPVTGMTVFDASAGCMARYDGAWQRPLAVAAPSGGATEDIEARAAIAELIAALVGAGILPPA